MKYLVGGIGWAPNHPTNPALHFLPAGTLIDDSLPQWSALVGKGPPIDAAPMDWETYFYMISWYVEGLGYPYTQVSTRFLTNEAFVLDESRLGGPDVLGPAPTQQGFARFGPTPSVKTTIGPNIDYWGRPTPWTE
jgi:hypothetical protein